MVVYRFYPQQQDGSFPASLALVDLRSGRLAYSNPWLALKVGGGFDMSLQPEYQAVDVHLGDQKLQFTFTSEPRPPQPVFRFGPLFQITEVDDVDEQFQPRLFGR